MNDPNWNVIAPDISVEDFVRRYGLLVTSKRVLQYGLLIACGDSHETALRLLGMTDEDDWPILCELQKIGYLQIQKAKGDSNE